MTEVETKEMLLNKVKAEQKCYRKWLQSQTTEEVLCHTYEYSVREDIIIEIEEETFSRENPETLLKSPDLLSDIYMDFCRLETDYMELIRQVIANRIGKEKTYHEN